MVKKHNNVVKKCCSFVTKELSHRQKTLIVCSSHVGFIVARQIIWTQTTVCYFTQLLLIFYLFQYRRITLG